MLRIHFINVGHGDCCLIEFPHTGRNYMVDINMTDAMAEGRDAEIPEGFGFSPADIPELIHAYKTGFYNATENIHRHDPLRHLLPRQNPIEYLKKRKIQSIFRFISTHPHMDHLAGLAGLLESVRVANFWVLPNKFVPVGYEALSELRKNDWHLYAAIRDCKHERFNGMRIESPTEGTDLPFLDEDGITILAPSNDLLTRAAAESDENHMSCVLLVQHGQCRILLGADALNPTWNYLVDKYDDALKNVTILKAPHHGLVCGSHTAALSLMSPRYAVVTAGQKQYSNVSKEYATYCDTVLSTAWQGNVVFECDPDGDIECETQYGHNLQAEPPHTDNAW